MKAIPQIQKYMTTAPLSINGNATLAEAVDMMKKKDIRHLPVVLGEKFGVVSDRDLKFAMSLSGVNPKTSLVKDICDDSPYLTNPAASLSAVSSELATRKVGSALVVDNGHLVGIFTTTDACQALADLCEGRLTH